jgi:glycerate-2-kinase
MLKINDREKLAFTKSREKLLAAIECGFTAINTKDVIKRQVSVKQDTLKIQKAVFTLKTFRHILVVGIGKCALDAAEALEEILGDRIYRGIVCDVRKGKLQRIDSRCGDHPFPTEANVEATREMIALLKTAKQDDLVIVIVSGGGSTLLCQPRGITYANERDILACLFRAGASITEINTLRKHLSSARGGFLAKYAYPARVIGLVFSDIISDDLQYIASGPTVRDTSTIRDARSIALSLSIKDQCHLKELPLMETPKNPKYFERVSHFLLASNRIGLQAIARSLRKQGYRVRVMKQPLFGEASQTGVDILSALHKTQRKTALLYGGETTVTVRGAGKGGRNMELALATLPLIYSGEILAAVASDGCDNSEYAGAIVDTHTMRKADDLNMDPQRFLAKNDSYHFFKKNGGLIHTGKTGSNVADWVIALND